MIVIEKVVKIGLKALWNAFLVHEDLGEKGEKLVEKNQFGDTALRADIEAEKAVLDTLREDNLPIKVISEEHGVTEISKKQSYLGILDGLDGSNVYKKSRGIGRYGTMFAIFQKINPCYEDYLFSGIMEHATKKLYFAIKNKGSFVIQGGKKKPINSNRQKLLNKQIKIYIDEYFEINRKTFSTKLRGFKTVCLGSSAIYYADVAAGKASLALECTRKNNLEIAIAYGLITEAGGAMLALDGEGLKKRKYLTFGQTKQIPVITASTEGLARDLIDFLQK